MLDRTTFIPKTVDTTTFHFHCACFTLSTILTGNPNQDAKIEEIIPSLRKEGPDRHLLKLLVTAPLFNDPDDFKILTTRCLRMLAGVFRNYIYMFYETDEFEQSHWDCYTGNKLSPNRGGIYFKSGMSGETALLY